MPELVSPYANEAERVYASPKLLEAAHIAEEKRFHLGKDILSQMKECLSLAEQGHSILILASGDALFHGIGGTLQRLNNNQQPLRFIPAPTAFQSLCHKVGLPWEQARLFSVHAQKDIPLLEILSQPMSIVYGGSPYTAADIARMCIDFFPPCQKWEALLASELGTDHEQIIKGNLLSLSTQKCAPTSILIIRANPEETHAPELTLGLSSDFYEKEASLITQEDVRVLALSKLRLPAWGVLWDIGAGSGSVGLEAAGLRPQLQVFAVEQHKHRIPHILENKRRLGLDRYTVLQGKAPEIFTQLPNPDRIFIGGGGKNLTDILSSAFLHLKPDGLIVATAVTLESFILLRDWYPNYRTQLLSLDIAHCVPIAGNYDHFRHQNRIYLFTFQKPCPIL